MAYEVLRAWRMPIELGLASSTGRATSIEFRRYGTIPVAASGLRGAAAGAERGFG